MKNKSLNLKTKELMKRAVSFITAVAMVITILPLQPITAFAEENPEGYTYDAGSNTYTVSTFDGLATALAAGGNIVLNNDITKDNPNAETPVPAGVTAVLDLNGKTITLADGVGTIYDVISVYGNLTIKDSATGGTIDASVNSIAGALYCEPGSILTIESGTYKSGDINPDIAIYGGNIDIKGGTFIGGNSLWVSDDADIDIYGGTFEKYLTINYGTADIYGGVIRCLVIDSQGIDSVTIHGGQIDELYDNNNAPLLIKGGTFGFDPSQYIDRQNYKVGDGGENKYTVECLHNDIKGGIVTPNNDGTHTFECTVCGETIKEECSGGTASCTEKAVCTVCSTAYGQLNGHSFGADNVCTVCGLTGGYCGAATNEGGVESLLWTLSDGTLTISGNGAMADYDRADNYAPWFNHRNDITKAVVNSGVTTIGDDAFTSCTVMTKCQIPETVTSIGESAFTYCKALTAINVDAANTAYKSVDGVLFTKDGSTLVKYPEGKTATEYTIPSTVRTIGDLAFFAAENLEKVIIPNGVTAIGKETFGSCASLTEITFQSSDITVASDAFIDCNALTTVNAPCDWLETTYKFADTVTVNLQHSYDNGFCTICDGYQPAVLTADKYDLNKDGEKDSVYEIGNAGQLYWFIDFVGNGNYHAYAVLTDDIVVNEGNVYGCNGTKAEGWREWTPVNYSGVFDGQGHTVSGIYCNVTSPYDVGFIGFLYCDSGYAAVQNLGVVNSYFNGRRTGGIVGKVQQKNSRNIAKVVNCYSQVYLMGGETSGAIVGQLWDGTVENCYSYGENAAGVAGYAGSYANVINCYYNKDLYKGSAIWSNNGTTDRVEYKTTQQFASGEVAYLLQGSQTERVWGQDIDNGNPAQPYPVFAGAQVNYGHRNCGDIEKTYTNSAVSDTAFSHTDITHFATGNVITATCGACTKAAGTVTVTAYTKVYDGAEHGLITVEATGTLAGGTYTVTYTGENYNSTTAPTDAGEYTASVTVGGATASAQFTIIKATLTADDFTFTPPVERVYDGEEKQATVTTDKTGMGEITVHYYNSDGEEAAPVDAGTYTVKIDVAESENYSAVTGLTDNYWTFSIQKADPVFTAPQAIEGLAYTGQPQVLVTPGTSDHGTFFYHIIGDEDSPELPTGTEVRTYEISWQLKGDKNHFNSSPKYLNVTISTADQTPLKITGIPDTVTYGDIFKLSATGGDGQGGMSWAVSRGSYNATIDQQGNVTVKGTGDFTVTLIRYGDHHYNDASVSHTFTSQPKQLTDAVVSVDGGLVYNGAPHTPAVSVTLDGVTLEENTDYILEYNNNINASAQATVTATGMGNYAGTVTKTFTVDKAEPTADMFTVTYPSDMVYDGNAKTVTATVKAGFTGVGDILVKYYDENGYLVNQVVNAGKYTVKLSVSEGENYHATQEPIFPTDGSSWEFEITKVTAAVTTAPTANQLTYDGTAQALVTAGTTDGGKFAYSLSEDGQYSETIPTGITAGEYTVWYYIVGDGNHFNSAKSFVKVTVGKADQQIEIKDIPATVTYGDVFKLSAQLGEGSMDTSWSIESGADNATIDGNGNIAVTGAGDFTVTLTSHGQQNYSDKTVSHTFTAQKKQLSVAEVIAEDKFYNGKTDATIEEITLRGIVNEDSVVALGTAQFADKNAGVAKPVTITGLTLKGSAAENYTLDVTTVETTADIIPALIKVAPKSGQSKVYGTADGEFAYEITVGKLYGDDKLTGALGREEGETVGEYAYTIGTLANSDYNIALEATDKFEIVKGTPEYTAPTGLSATYGDTLAKVKLPEGWAWKDETTTSVGDIGENKFTAIFTPADTANYNTVEVELTVKVNAKPAEKPVHKHSWSGLKNDSTSHYYECACGAKDEVTAHTYNTSGRCTVCGYYNANAVAKPVVTPTPAPTATPQPTEKPVEMPKEADTTITEAKPTEEAVEAAKDNVTVSEGTAQLNKEAVEAVADAQNEEKEIVLPLTQTTENVVNEAEIYTEALAEIAKDGKDVVIQFTDATVKLEAEAVKALTKQAKGKTIEIRAVIVEAHTLNEHQQEELKDMDYVVIISVQAFSDGEYIGQFRGGKATVMLPFELDSGTKADEYHVYYIDEKGDLHKAASEYIDGYMVFTTVHFSEYIIVHEAAQNDDTVVVTPQQPEQETSLPILPIIIAVTAIVIILIIFKKKKEEEE